MYQWRVQVKENVEGKWKDRGIYDVVAYDPNAASVLAKKAAKVNPTYKAEISPDAFLYATSIKLMTGAGELDGSISEAEAEGEQASLDVDNSADDR